MELKFVALVLIDLKLSGSLCGTDMFSCGLCRTGSR